MADSKMIFALGLAQKAGKVISGDFAVRGALQNGKAKLMLLAVDAAASSKKEMLYLAETADVPVMEFLTKAELGHALGKAQRAAAVITDNNFVKMLNKK